jgi:FkbM family methyltransferase
LIHSINAKNLQVLKPDWYYKLKFTRIGRMFSRWRHPEWWSAQQNAYAYYGAVLKGKNGLVFDLGANVGDLTAVFVQLGMRVIACEPDPVNFTILKARFRHIPDVTVLEVAISDKTGTVELYPMAAHGRSLTTISEKRRRQLAGHTGSAGGGNFDPTQTVNSMTPAE